MKCRQQTREYKRIIEKQSYEAGIKHKQQKCMRDILKENNCLHTTSGLCDFNSKIKIDGLL